MKVFNSEEIYEGTGLAFFRCRLCGSVVSPWDLEKHHACAKCGKKEITPTSLGFWEKVVQIIKHPMVWKWKEREEWG